MKRKHSYDHSTLSEEGEEGAWDSAADAVAGGAEDEDERLELEMQNDIDILLESWPKQDEEWCKVPLWVQAQERAAAEAFRAGQEWKEVAIHPRKSEERVKALIRFIKRNPHYHDYDSQPSLEPRFASLMDVLENEGIEFDWRNDYHLPLADLRGFDPERDWEGTFRYTKDGRQVINDPPAVRREKVDREVARLEAWLKKPADKRGNYREYSRRADYTLPGQPVVSPNTLIESSASKAKGHLTVKTSTTVARMADRLSSTRLVVAREEPEPMRFDTDSVSAWEWDARASDRHTVWQGHQLKDWSDLAGNIYLARTDREAQVKLLSAFFGIDMGAAIPPHAPIRGKGFRVLLATPGELLEPHKRDRPVFHRDASTGAARCYAIIDGEYKNTSDKAILWARLYRYDLEQVLTTLHSVVKSWLEANSVRLAKSARKLGKKSGAIILFDSIESIPESTWRHKGRPEIVHLSDLSLYLARTTKRQLQPESQVERRAKRIRFE